MLTSLMYMYSKQSIRASTSSTADHEPHSRHVPFNKIWRRTAIIAQCWWWWCTQLSGNHADYSTLEMHCSERRSLQHLQLHCVLKYLVTKHLSYKSVLLWH